MPSRTWIVLQLETALAMLSLVTYDGALLPEIEKDRDETLIIRNVVCISDMCAVQHPVCKSGTNHMPGTYSFRISSCTWPYHSCIIGTWRAKGVGDGGHR